MKEYDVQHYMYLAKLIRKEIICSANEYTKYHFGGTFSCIEMLIYIYLVLLNSCNLNESNRDSVILSKGHSCLAMYTLFFKLGYISYDELLTYGQFGSRLQGHPHMKKLKYIDFSSGSLGQGLSVAVGMALANRCMDSNNKIYVILGDGELQEGQVWEAAMCAAHFKLNNLICFIDRNKMQVDGDTELIMSVEPLRDKWVAFGWSVAIVNNGHDFLEIDDAFQSIKRDNKPKILILNTVKGKGVSFMEGKKEWHSGNLSQEEINRALLQLENHSILDEMPSH